MNILLIDNYDSFTFNIYQYLLELGHHVECYRNDSISISDIERKHPDMIFISPGPKAPKDAGICLDVVRYFAGKISIFGVCLGHQTIGEAFGARIVHAKSLFHGKMSTIISRHKGIMEHMNEFTATRYHSLAIERQSLPPCLEITCETSDGEIMGVKHRDYNIEGVQFHPESIMTDNGKALLQSFINRTKMLHSQCEPSSYPNSQIEPQFLKYSDSALHHAPASSIDVPQYATQLNLDKAFFDIFAELYSNFGEENVFLLDSAHGPKIDCSDDIIGLFPKFDLVIEKGKMYVQSNHPSLLQLFKHNFISLYAEQEDCFVLADGIKFSDIFPVISKMFNMDPKHNLKIRYSHGLVGFFTYEYLHYLEMIERSNIQDLAIPDVHLTYYSCILKHDSINRITTIINNSIVDSCQAEYVSLMRLLTASYKGSPKGDVISRNMDHAADYTLTMDEEQYYKKVAKAKQYIVDGEIFQVQLGARVHTTTSASSLDIYRLLREVNPSPYMFLWKRGACALIGNSPELQLKVQNEKVLIRPIAGTSKGKGRTPEDREVVIHNLVNSEKEQAEHIMLVDLARNDIGRIAKPGSVMVDELMEVSEFSHVFHLVSSVTGTIPNNVNTMKLFEATFPAGTLTGAPKIRAMEIIQELEEYERGPYGGALGFFDFNGDIVSTIIIRTIVKIDEDLYLQASAGIVSDSTDIDEWNEIQFKTDAIRHVLSEIRRPAPTL